MQFEIKTQKKIEYLHGSYFVPIITGKLGLGPANYAAAGWVMLHPLLPNLSGISAIMIKIVTNKQKKMLCYPCRVIRMIYQSLTAELPLCPRPADLLENH